MGRHTSRNQKNCCAKKLESNNIEGGFTCTGTQPSVCTATCGNGVVNTGEACDDGNGTAGDGCTACAVDTGFTCAGTMPSVCGAICGDGLIRGSEQCDDAPPAENGDGCSAACLIESGFTCSGEPSVCAPN